MSSVKAMYVRETHCVFQRQNESSGERMCLSERECVFQRERERERETERERERERKEQNLLSICSWMVSRTTLTLAMADSMEVTSV